MGYFSFLYGQDGTMRYSFADFKISFAACPVRRGSHVFPMPLGGCCCQQGRCFSDRPRSALVETDGHGDIQVRIICFVELGKVVVTDGIIDGAVGNLHNEIFGGNTVILYFMNQDTSAQFFVQIYQAVKIFSGFHIYFFANQFGYILQRGDFVAVSLHQYLVGNDVFAAKLYTVFEFLRDREVIGYQIAFTGQ